MAESLTAAAPSRWRAVLAAGVIVAAAVAAYLPALGAGYVWDDDLLLTRNPFVRSPGGLYHLWLTGEAKDYTPLTSTTFWLEWRLWGDWAGGYHAVNVLLHALSAVLLWRVLRAMAVPGAYLAGILFAVHPVTAASAAWIAERKNTLSMALYLLSVLAWLRYDGGAGRKWYGLSLGAFAAALLAKGAAVMGPVVLLLLAWYRRGRIGRKDLMGTVPLFVLSLGMGLVTIWFQQGHAIAGEVVRSESWAARIAATGGIVWFYLYKILLPIHLAVIYPRWPVDGSFVSFLPLAALVAALAGLWLLRGRIGRGALAAAGYFVVMLLPVLGLVDMAFLLYSRVADHLQYFAMPGILALGAALAAGAWRRLGLGRAAGAVAGGVAVAGLGSLTFVQAGIYHDGETLWRSAIASHGQSAAARYGLGCALAQRGRLPEAVQYYGEALALQPEYMVALANRGEALLRLGRLDEALADLDRAVALDKGFVQLFHRAQVYERLRRPQDAMGDYDAALALIPEAVEARVARGRLLMELGQYETAIDDFTAALTRQDDQVEALERRGMIYFLTERYDRAIPDLDRLLSLQKDNAQACHIRAICCFRTKQYDRAWNDIATCRKLGLNPSPRLVADLTAASGRAQ